MTQPAATLPELSLSWPPPPHDPRERGIAMRVDGWEVRLFDERKFQYFVTRGLWHLQLWHPVARVSVLSPSRLTCGFYEAYPIVGWKAQAADYDRLVRLLATAHPVALPGAAVLARIERAFVDDAVAASMPATFSGSGRSLS